MSVYLSKFEVGEWPDSVYGEVLAEIAWARWTAVLVKEKVLRARAEKAHEESGVGESAHGACVDAVYPGTAHGHEAAPTEKD